MAGYRVVRIYSCGFWSTDRALAQAVFADVQARVPKAKLVAGVPMPDNVPSDFRVKNLPIEGMQWRLLKLFCERGGEPFAVDGSEILVRFKD